MMSLSPRQKQLPRTASASSSTGGEPLIQIINYEGEVVADIDAWMRRQHLTDRGFHYNVVTILGAQSSGKSSLVNALFGCQFQVMDHLLGHSQTTKGIWLGRDAASAAADAAASSVREGREARERDGLVRAASPTSCFSAGTTAAEARAAPACIVVDVEGIDSRERGEDRQTFEYRSALFALALADCLIINTWYQSLGNFTSSGYGLLRTVLEVNLELFAQEKNTPKTILLFAVRDWAACMTPLETVRHKIEKEYVEKIWSEIQKPAGLEASSPYDLFDIRVYGFAHKFMDPESFNRDVDTVRKEWLLALRPRKYSRGIPADGFPHYATSIWEVIKKQSHLNIPSQREMLATYRCQEIKAAVLAAQTTKAAAAHAALQQHPLGVSQLAAALKQLGNAALTEYMEQASRYKLEICMRVRQELLDGLTVTLQPLVDGLLTRKRDALNLHFVQCLSTQFGQPVHLATTLQENTLGQPPAQLLAAWTDFNKTCASLMERTAAEFAAAAAACDVQLRDGASLRFSADLILDGLQQAMRRDVEATRQKQQLELTSFLQKTCRARFAGIGDTLTSREFSAAHFWEACRLKAAAAAAECEEVYVSAALGLAAPYDEQQQQLLLRRSHSRSSRRSSSSEGEAATAVRVSSSHVAEHKAGAAAGGGAAVAATAGAAAAAKQQEEADEEERKRKRNEKREECVRAAFQKHARLQALLQLRQHMEGLASNLQPTIVDRFQTFFTFDGNDQPRQWELISPEKLQQLFVEAKDQALSLIPTLSRMQLGVVTLRTPSLLAVSPATAAPPAAAEGDPAFNRDSVGRRSERERGGGDGRVVQTAGAAASPAGACGGGKHVCASLSAAGAAASASASPASCSSPWRRGAATAAPEEGKEGDDKEEEEDEEVPQQFYAPLLDELQQQALQQRVLRQLQQLCRDAQAIQRGGGGKAGASWRSIPLWGYLLLLVLGWDEFAAVLAFFWESGWLLLLLLPFFLFAAVFAAAAAIGGGGGLAGAVGGLRDAASRMQQLMLLLQALLVPLIRQLLMKLLRFLEPPRPPVTPSPPQEAPASSAKRQVQSPGEVQPTNASAAAVGAGGDDQQQQQHRSQGGNEQQLRSQSSREQQHRSRSRERRQAAAGVVQRSHPPFS